ncbi:MAG TPA: acyl-CoA dehydrogenase family protein [Acidimicrobiales bacterium]|nr:acyl-CoA dehydrogenase family protein [Acidimicrobiales bacterium]
MNLLPDAAQQALVDAAEAVLSSGDADPAVRFAAWAGQGLFAPAASLTELSLLGRTLGRHLATGPYLGTALAVRLAAAGGHDHLAEELAAGRRPVALAQPVDRAAPEGRLLVFDDPRAPLVLVVTPAGATLHPTGGTTPVARHGLDPLVPMAETELARPALAGTEGDRPFLEGTLLAAALAAGLAEATRDRSAAHARTREQFGRPIGTFQAVAHRCAAMAIRAEAATCQVSFAALSLDAAEPDAPLQVAAAKVVAVDAAIHNATDDIQNHGAAGCSAEDDAHLYLKRAWVTEHLFGPSHRHLGALAGAPALQEAPA